MKSPWDFSPYLQPTWTNAGFNKTYGCQLGAAPEALLDLSKPLSVFSKNSGKYWTLIHPLVPRQDQVFSSVVPDTHFSNLVLRPSRIRSVHPSCRLSTPMLT